MKRKKGRRRLFKHVFRRSWRREKYSGRFFMTVLILGILYMGMVL